MIMYRTLRAVRLRNSQQVRDHARAVHKRVQQHFCVVIVLPRYALVDLYSSVAFGPASAFFVCDTLIFSGYFLLCHVRN